MFRYSWKTLVSYNQTVTFVDSRSKTEQSRTVSPKNQDSSPYEGMHTPPRYRAKQKQLQKIPASSTPLLCDIQSRSSFIPANKTLLPTATTAARAVLSPLATHSPSCSLHSWPPGCPTLTPECYIIGHARVTDIWSNLFKGAGYEIRAMWGRMRLAGDRAVERQRAS